MVSKSVMRIKKRSKASAKLLNPNSKRHLRLARHPQGAKPTASSKPGSTSNELTLAKHSHQNRGKKGKRRRTRLPKRRGLDKINQIENMRSANSKGQSTKLAFLKEFMMKKSQKDRNGWMVQEVSRWEVEAVAR